MTTTKIRADARNECCDECGALLWLAPHEWRALEACVDDPDLIGSLLCVRCCDRVYNPDITRQAIEAQVAEGQRLERSN